MTDLAPLYQRLEPNPDAEYGGILPFARNRVGSASWVREGDNLRFALPAIVRDGLRGYLDLANSTQTGSLTPEALQAMTLGSLGAGVSMAPRGALAAGGSIKAYHGSPHSFDRFDASKIGTGEGAQAFGHGLYFAENENVARAYQPKGWRPSDEYKIGNQDIGDLYQRFADRGQYDKAAVLENVLLHNSRQHIENLMSDNPAALAYLKTLPDNLFAKPSGNMYEVRINADPAQFLNLDKPLNAQSSQVQGAIRPLITQERLSAEGYTDPTVMSLWENPSGNMIYRNAPLAGKDSRVTSAAEASAALRDAGIPGLQYLDGGSRGFGTGTNNYVVFPGQEHLIEILRKYGLAAPAPVAVPAETNTGKPTPAQREAMSRGLF